MPRKKPTIALEHRTFGFGNVKYRTVTDYGDALVMEFGDSHAHDSVGRGRFRSVGEPQ